jgi:hypothetical protein
MSLKEEKRAKVKDLIVLALDEETPAKEQRNAAILALKIIRKYKLLDTPKLDGVLEHPAVRAAKIVADKLSDSELTDSVKELFDLAGVVTSAARRRRRH